MTDTEAVQDVLQQLYTAWADNDAEAFAALYTEDGTIIMPGVFHDGRPAILDFWKAAFADRMKGSRGVDEPQSVRIVGGNTAIMISKGGIVMAGQDEPARVVRATWVLTKQDGRWLIAAYSNAPE